MNDIKQEIWDSKGMPMRTKIIPNSYIDTPYSNSWNKIREMKSWRQLEKIDTLYAK